MPQKNHKTLAKMFEFSLKSGSQNLATPKVSEDQAQRRHHKWSDNRYKVDSVTFGKKNIAYLKNANTPIEGQARLINNKPLLKAGTPHQGYVNFSNYELESI